MLEKKVFQLEFINFHNFQTYLNRFSESVRTIFLLQQLIESSNLLLEIFWLESEIQKLLCLHSTVF